MSFEIEYNRPRQVIDSEGLQNFNIKYVRYKIKSTYSEKQLILLQINMQKCLCLI